MTNDTSYLALQPVWKDRHGSGASTDQLADSASYDGWERLVQWKGTKNTTTLVESESYTFDANGNISQPTGAAVYDRVTDRLVSRVEGATTRLFKYDRGGVLTNDSLADNSKRWVFGYDALGRLVSVRYNGALMARYGYDVLGRRLAKRVYSTSSGGALAYTRFVYHGEQIAFETDSAGTIGLRYTYGLGTDALLAVRDAAGNHYYTLRNKLGSIRGLVKQDGTWWLSQRFSPYGLTVQRDTNSAGPSVPLRFGWIGREYDAETGYYYLRARYYSPTLRRFVAEDPTGYGGGSNLYAYTDGSPLETTDRNGMMKSVPTGYADYWADLMSKIQGAQMMGGGGGAGGGYSIDGVEVGSQMGGMYAASTHYGDFLSNAMDAQIATRMASQRNDPMSSVTGDQNEMTAYQAGKAQVANCAVGIGCPDAADQAAAQFGLGILNSAEQGKARLDIIFSNGAPLGTSQGTAYGREVDVNDQLAASRGLDLGAVTVHEVGEAYLFSVYRPNNVMPSQDYAFYANYAHPIAVVFLENPARMAGGYAPRSPSDLYGPDK